MGVIITVLGVMGMLFDAAGERDTAIPCRDHRETVIEHIVLRTVVEQPL